MSLAPAEKGTATTMNISRRALIGCGLSLSAVAVLTACGANSDPLAGSSAAPSGSAPAGEIIVGSASFTENIVLAHVYSQALVAKGQQSSVKASLGSREIYLPALRDGSISVVPEYTGNLLLYLDKEASATTADEVEQALPAAVGSDLKILKPSPAVDQDVYVVTGEFSQRNGVTSLTDLSKVAGNVTLGGPTELKKRDYGPPGLEQIYGAKLKSFKAYDSPAVKIKDLNDGKIQLATFFTTESAIADNGYVSLTDPQSMILPQNVIPLVRADVASNAAAVAVLDAVQAALTTEDLTALNKSVDSDRQDPKQVAADWLKSKSLA